MRHRRLLGTSAAAVAAAAGATSTCLTYTEDDEGAKRTRLRKSVTSSSLLPSIGPKAIDTALAGLGLWGGCSVLGLLEPIVGLPLFAPAMMASGIIFFAGSEPPHPKGFLSGTVCSATISLGVLHGLSTVFPPVVAQGGTAAALLMWYKTFGAIFPPAAVLAGALAAAMGSAGASCATSSIRASLRYLAFPWLIGHAWLYACASGMSAVRSHARVLMTTRELAALGDQTDDALRAIFLKFDTNHSGDLDAGELKVALRVALGMDLALSDCEQLIAVADRDGDGNIDFGEFVMICRQQL